MEYLRMSAKPAQTSMPIELEIIRRLKSWQKQVEVVKPGLGPFRSLYRWCKEDGDLTDTQALLLTRLEKPATMRDVATMLDCDPSNVTGLIDKLESRGLIERTASREDRRTKHITLTPKGEAARREVIDKIVKLFREKSGLTQSETETLVALMRKMTPDA
jgi:DNA-binding MarR family transcriptional regulator